MRALCNRDFLGSLDGSPIHAKSAYGYRLPQNHPHKVKLVADRGESNHII